MKCFYFVRSVLCTVLFIFGMWWTFEIQKAFVSIKHTSSLKSWTLLGTSPWDLTWGLLEDTVKTCWVMGEEMYFVREFSLRLRLQNVIVLLIQTGLIALGKLKGIIIIFKWTNCRSKAQFPRMGLCGDSFKRWEQLVLCALWHLPVF